MRKINEAKLKEYLENDEILEFETLEEARKYFNLYDFQDFKTVQEMKEYSDIYGFEYNGKWYHIDYEECLDVYEEEENA